MTGLIDKAGGLNFGAGLQWSPKLGNVGLDIIAGSTWNPKDLVDISLSNNGLTALSTLGSGNGGEVRSTSSRSSGKLYFTMTVNAGLGSSGNGSWVSGLANSIYSLSNFLGEDTNSVGYYAFSGVVLINDVTAATVGAATTGSVIWFAANLGSSLLWIRVGGVGNNWNANASANPSTGTDGISMSTITGPLFAAFEGSLTTSQVTANFSPSAVGDSTLTGFSPWT